MNHGTYYGTLWFEGAFADGSIPQVNSEIDEETAGYLIQKARKRHSVFGL